MKLAIITDSTSDLRPQQIEALHVKVVPLYVSFQGKTFRDWIEIDTTAIVEGVAAGAELPTTSQPSPQDFENAYREAAAEGAEQILCVTVSADLSGTYQSASLAKESVEVPVTVFDSRAASLGLGSMVKQAAKMRDAGAELPEIIAALEQIRDTNFALFTVASLEFLQKGGRIGRAAAMLGGLLNLKPILTVENGSVAPLGRARGNKKALRELVSQVLAYREKHPGPLVMNFMHVRDEAAAEELKREILAAGVEFEEGGIYELGAVLSCHVGPGTYGLYAHIRPE